jgi:hypothetical protein
MHGPSRSDFNNIKSIPKNVFVHLLFFDAQMPAPYGKRGVLFGSPYRFKMINNCLISENGSKIDPSLQVVGWKI